MLKGVTGSDRKRESARREREATDLPRCFVDGNSCGTKNNKNNTTDNSDGATITALYWFFPHFKFAFKIYIFFSIFCNYFIHYFLHRTSTKEFRTHQQKFMPTHTRSPDFNVNFTSFRFFGFRFFFCFRARLKILQLNYLRKAGEHSLIGSNTIQINFRCNSIEAPGALLCVKNIPRLTERATNREPCAKGEKDKRINKKPRQDDEHRVVDNKK